MNNKHALIEVFNFYIYDLEDNLLYSTETVMSNHIKHDTKYNTLIIKDAILDTALFQDVMSGKYVNRYVRVKGVTKVKSLDDGIDRELVISINVAGIEGYEIESSSPKISIIMPFADRNGNVNFNIELKDVAE